MIKNILKHVMIATLACIMIGSIFMASSVAVSANTSIFSVGNTYTYTGNYSYSSSATVSGITTTSSDNSKSTSTQKIVAINSTQKTVTAENVDPYSNTQLVNTTYNSSSSYLATVIVGLFYYLFYINSTTHKVYLTDFESNFNYPNALPIFTDANWSIVSAQLKSYFSNASSLAPCNINSGSCYFELVHPGYATDIAYPTTLGDLLGNMSSFKIMGQTTLTSTVSQFTNSTDSWTFEYNLGHHIYYYNATSSSFIPYSSYVATFSLNYNTAGLFTGYTYTLQTQLNGTNFSYNTNTQDQLQLGSGNSTPGFEVFTTVVAFSILVVPIIYLQKRNSKKQDL